MARQLKAPQIRRIMREAERQTQKYGINFPGLTEAKLKRLKVSELKQIHTKELRQKYGIIETETGEKKNAQTWFRERQNAMRRERRRRKKDGEKPPEVDDIVLQNIENLIHEYYGSHIVTYDHGAKMLREKLSEQISLYGRARVARSCEESAGQAWRTAEAVIFESSNGAKVQNLMTFVQIITGEAMSLDEAQRISDYVEQDESYEIDDED